MTPIIPMKSLPILIKLGGSALKDSEITTSLCHDLAQVSSSGTSLVVVHGGGPSINEELTARGISWKFYQGQRITTPEMMEVIEMVLCGKVNRKIVRTLNSFGVPAIGLSGTDSNLLHCNFFGGILGNVGSIQSINTNLISTLLKSGDGTLPVIAPVGTDGKGNALNVNADWAAAKIAQALGVQKLIYLTDQDGILDSQGRLIPEVDFDGLKNLIRNEVVTGGMLAKVNTILDGLRSGIREIHIVNAKRRHALLDALLDARHPSSGIGTLCKIPLFKNLSNLKRPKAIACLN
jgi:acetylglutamate kinase